MPWEQREGAALSFSYKKGGQGREEACLEYLGIHAHVCLACLVPSLPPPLKVMWEIVFGYLRTRCFPFLSSPLPSHFLHCLQIFGSSKTTLPVAAGGALLRGENTPPPLLFLLE